MEKHTAKQNHYGARAQTFLFEFGTDKELRSVAFKGAIPEPEISHILEAAHAHLYVNCAEAIHSYLDAHSLTYSDFTSGRIRLEHASVMASANSLLHADICECMDKKIGSADIYYGVMDYQHQTDRSCFEGCYYAVSRTSSSQKDPYEYHIICQTFQCNTSDSSEHACFAIRKNEGGPQLRTLDQADGEPVLATFGCVDMLRLLIHIRAVTTKQYAAELANR